MKIVSSALQISVDAQCLLQAIFRLTIASACFIFLGCTTGEFGPATDSAPRPIVQAPRNFETTLKQNHAALAERKGPPDVALYNIGVILAHPANPKRDQARALQAFKMVVAEHPRSTFAEPAKTWIQVLEQQQKLMEDRQKLAEEKRSLSRERETFLQERQRLNYAGEKSQQLDIEIEKRRRQLLSK